MTVNSIYRKEIIEVRPEDTLTHALSLLSSSHDAAFVIEDKKLLGVINPYYCVIKKSFPGNSKVKHCLVHPPYVDINTPIKKVIQLMTDSKIHYLPVFSQDEIYGVISARRILQEIKDMPELKVPISGYIKQKRTLLSVYEKDFLSQALSLFKKYKVSKLIVLSKDLKLRGILAYYDLISSLIMPKKREHWGGKEGTKSPILKQYIKNYMKTTVLTLTSQDTLSKAAQMILDKKIGSIIVVDTDRTPLGIITTRDLLLAFMKGKDSKKVELITRHVSDGSRGMIQQFLTQLTRRLQKDGSKAKVIIKEEKNGGLFETVVSIFKENRPVKVFRDQGKNLSSVLNTIHKKIKR